MVFGYYAFLVYAILILIIVIVGGMVVVRRNKKKFENSLIKYWKFEAGTGGWYHPILLAFRSLFTEGNVTRLQSKVLSLERLKI